MDKWVIRTGRSETNESDIHVGEETVTPSKVRKISPESLYATISSVVQPQKSSEEPTSSNIKGTKKCRKYQEEYIKYGFTSTVINDEQRPLCVICFEKLASESMKPVKLKRHLETKHPELIDKNESYFKRRANNMQNQKNFNGKTFYNSTKSFKGIVGSFIFNR